MYVRKENKRMGKDFIDEFIPSKDTRAYLHSIHYEFTDLEKATIVANHIMISYEEKVKWLNNFMHQISDDALKDRISKALENLSYNESFLTLYLFHMTFDMGIL